jgi:nitrate reductase (cytochrome), electron transfer subunit
MNHRVRALMIVSATAVVALVATWTQAVSQDVTSIRGVDVNEAELPPGSYRMLPDGAPMPRDYVQQPPLVPHKVEGYEISLNFNKCMDCHSWTRHRAAGATKISLTHFRDRDANELSSVAPRRYFCLQCHVPVTDAQPLVENTFTPATGLR